MIRSSSRTLARLSSHRFRSGGKSSSIRCLHTGHAELVSAGPGGRPVTKAVHIQYGDPKENFAIIIEEAGQDLEVGSLPNQAVETGSSIGRCRTAYSYGSEEVEHLEARTINSISIISTICVQHSP